MFTVECGCSVGLVSGGNGFLDEWVCVGAFMATMWVRFWLWLLANWFVLCFWLILDFGIVVYLSGMSVCLFRVVFEGLWLYMSVVVFH